MGYWRIWHEHWETASPSKARHGAFRRMTGTGTFSSKFWQILCSMPSFSFFNVSFFTMVQISIELIEHYWVLKRDGF